MTFLLLHPEPWRVVVEYSGALVPFVRAALAVDTLGFDLAPRSFGVQMVETGIPAYWECEAGLRCAAEDKRWSVAD